MLTTLTRLLGTAVLGATAVGSPLWTVTPTPTFDGNIELNNVGCVGATCLALSSTYDNETDYGPTALRYAHGAWTAVPFPTVPGEYVDQMSCVPSGFCMAVGNTEKAGGPAGSWMWNGARWRQVSVPTPAGYTSAFLGDVTCLSANSCLAIGAANSDTGSKSLLLGWDGTTWKPRPSAGLFKDGYSTSDMSCWSVDGCLATGSHVVGGETDFHVVQDAYRFDGTRWTHIAVPGAPNGGTNALVGSITCLAADDCVTVGSSLPAGGTVTTGMAARWNGSAWTSYAVPHLDAAASEGLGPVSCPTADRCTAQLTSNDPDQTDLDTAFVHTIDGGRTWTLQQAPAKVDGEERRIETMACSTVLCMAVGNDYVPGVDTYMQEYAIRHAS